MMTTIQERFLKSLEKDMKYTSLSRNKDGIKLYSKEETTLATKETSTYKILEGVDIPNKKTSIKTIMKNNKG